MSQYDVGADGALSFKRPATVPAGRTPFAVGISPDGASVYVTDQGAVNIPGALYQFDVASDGTLSAKTPASLAAGRAPTGIAVSPAFATAVADVLTGTAGDDVICGLGGSDKISGLGGDDTLFGDRCRAQANAAGRRPGARRSRRSQRRGRTGPAERRPRSRSPPRRPGQGPATRRDRQGPAARRRRPRQPVRARRRARPRPLRRRTRQGQSGQGRHRPGAVSTSSGGSRAVDPRIALVGGCSWGPLRWQVRACVFGSPHW